MTSKRESWFTQKSLRATPNLMTTTSSGLLSGSYQTSGFGGRGNKRLPVGRM